MFLNYNRFNLIITIGHHMCSSNASPLHVFIDQHGIIGKTQCINQNSKLILEQRKITIGITTSSVICFANVPCFC